MVSQLTVAIPPKSFADLKEPKSPDLAGGPDAGGGRAPVDPNATVEELAARGLKAAMLAEYQVKIASPQGEIIRIEGEDDSLKPVQIGRKSHTVCPPRLLYPPSLRSQR